VLAAPNLTQAALVQTRPVVEPGSAWWPLATQLMVAVCLLTIAVVMERGAVPLDPLWLGVLVGVGLSGVTVLLSRGAPRFTTPLVVVILGLLVLLVVVGVAAFVLTQQTLPLWGRQRLALGILLLTVPQVTAYAPGVTEVGIALDVGVLVAGCVLLCSTSLALARLSILERRSSIQALHERLAVAEASVRRDRARLHEIGATVAGIASATRLIQSGPVVLPMQRRSDLEHMMEAEVARLERIMLEETPVRHWVFDLDETVTQLVVGQAAQGRGVAWSPSGLRVRGCPDDVAEILHVLLENAARHGGASGVSVSAERHGGVVEIAVSDCGPGIDPSVRHEIFEWGAHGPDSPGEGIGLHIARDLAERQGGYLLLDNSPGPGTTFVLGLLDEVAHYDSIRDIAG
jgi:signal transduction histidine kinase